MCDFMHLIHGYDENQCLHVYAVLFLISIYKYLPWAEAQRMVQSKASQRGEADMILGLLIESCHRLSPEQDFLRVMQ
jgi:hypothetical protein